MSEPHPAVAAILAVTPEWAGVYGARRRVAARQAADVLRWLAGREDANGPLCCCTACLPDIIDEIEEAHRG